MTQKLPYRSEVIENETWDLSHLFPTSESFEKSVKHLLEQSQSFRTQYLNKLLDVSTIESALDDLNQLLIELDRGANYAEMQLSVDTTDSERQRLEAFFTSHYGKILSQFAFLETELLALDENVLKDAIDQSKYAYYLTRLHNRKKYQLDATSEELLANLSEALNSPSHIYGITKMLDIDFGQFEVDGKLYDMDYTTFEGIYEDHENTSLRRESFKHFSDTIRRYQHTTAALYNRHVQNEKIEANLRGYDSVFDFLLEEQDVTSDMYHRQIDVIMSDLAPIMRRYAKVIQRTNHLDEMRFEDLKISVDPTYEPQISIEESKSYIYGALGVLGQDYLDMVQKAYDERWIDFPQNKGKDTGAYCASPYASHSYIFISWTGKMTETFVLAHELGHAGHFNLAQRNQNFLQSEASMYFVEAPSTMNEMLMLDYLLKQSEDPKFKRWAIGSIIARTYYHNMVTHLLEAAYQREVYRLVDKGETLTAPILNQIKKEVITNFWGEDITITEGAELTWMRQPHYYMGLYSYTYSAGLTIGTIMAHRIQKEGKPAVEAWLETLKAGGSVSPLELANKAGIDISTDQPLKETIAFIESLVSELEQLTQHIEKNN
ncbi:oligoendopeptidase F [Staphylococcus canis]|uniref:Oligopeptidase F n=1 Tax=Staphylococcus canis TaxID=2724942 RepID=A0ABS0T9N5_9STAP|nr:oligoendopeptidase F [Staphylococcus canis]MBI5975437.1 oligoendopeptidase F [Staphylococcus canis]